jgi:glucose-1-phosphate adenylyltransferase
VNHSLRRAGKPVRRATLIKRSTISLKQSGRALLTRSRSAPGVCEGSTICGAIVDKNCQIGKNVHIECLIKDPPDADFGDVSIRDGITCIHKGAVLPDGWRLPHETGVPVAAGRD